MKTTYTDEQLRSLFQSSFNINVWCKFLHDFFEAQEIKAIPEKIDTNSATAEDGYYLGNLDNDGFRIGMFYYEIKHGSVVNRRVGLRNLVRSFINPRWGEFDAALVVFNSGDHWRLSFICDIKGESTSPKRYTYVFGSKELLYKTPIERFKFLQQKGISFETMKKAFSVEALSDEFFDKYREQYANFVQYVTGKRVVKVGGKWEERNVSEPDEALMSAFGNDDKKVRDYIKKMMGRITFLHFLQRKRWLCGDLNYMQNLYERSKYKDNYLDAVLEPLFFGILNTKPAERRDLFVSSSWDLALLEECKDIPYLNGGLFERDKEDEPDSVFPAKYFSQLFQFFSEYNFTIDENDPNDAEVGVDPEMLGKIFENLLEDNKDKGAFYTPKEIVRYMCQESLIAYLETNTSIAVDKLRNFVLSPEESVADIPQQKRPKLIEALQNVKICDPAIGSGAFPMGLLNELLRCREALSSEHYDRAELKKSIIQNNIYGVDIEKGAVDIARLRFWLSIVVDEDTPSPLPNLDYKIMQGNSLIESFEGIDLSNLVKKQIPNKNVDGIQTSILDEEIDIHQNRLLLLLSEYFTCYDHDRKVQLQNQISKSISAQLDANKINSVTLSKLKTINIAANNQFFLWHTWFADVFAKGGFDIVIGNPPYIRQEKLGKEYKDLLCTHFPNVGNGIADIYVYFFGLGLKLLSPNGILILITLNKYLKTKYGRELRNTLAYSACVDLIIDFFELPVFNASADAAITKVFRNNRNVGTRYFPMKTLENLDLFKITSGDFLATIKDSDEWKFVSGSDEQIIDKLYKGSISLKEFSNNRIYRGITTGLNKAFVIKDRIVAEKLISSESYPIVKKYAQSTDIGRWQIKDDDKYFIATGYDIDVKSLYPTIYNYLCQFKSELEVRCDKGVSFYNLRACAYYDEFEKNKIIYIHTAKNHKFYLDTDGHYINNSCYMIVSDSSFLFCFLNSKLFQYFKRLKFVAYGDGQEAGRCKLDYNKMVTVPIKANVDERPFKVIVEEAKNKLDISSSLNMAEYEKKIDQMIYEAYGLTDAEIKIIEQNI